MATIAQTSMRGNPATVTTTASTASDTLTYSTNTGQVLLMRNTTAGSLNVTIDGSGATTINPPGYGGSIDISTGKVIAVGANATVVVPLDQIKAFLVGTIAITHPGSPGDIIYSLLG